MRAAGLIAALLGAAATAWAGASAAADIVSPRPSALAVTIYRDEAIANPAAAEWAGSGLGMISETRIVDLPAGDSRVVFQGVADGTLPQTAMLRDLPGQIVEQNFDFDLLSPGSLIGRSVDQRVQVVRTNPRSGRQTAEDAVLRSGPDGAVLDFGDRTEALHCGGPPERLVFAQIPPGLTGRAALSTHVRVQQAGRYRLTLAYLTVGLAWNAAYVARVAPDGHHLDLSGWVTLANHDGASFTNATTSVVAGRLARQAVALAQRIVSHRAPGCWPMGNSHHPQGDRLYLAEAEEMMLARDEAKGMVMSYAMAPMAIPAPAPPPPPPMARQSDLGDYKLYTLDGPTTVAGRQTKQVLFLHQPDVAFDTVYVARLSSQYANPLAIPSHPTEITLRLDNKPAKGLGRALPAGAVLLRQAQGGRDQVVGQPALRDVPVGEPFELVAGQASDVQARWSITEVKRFSRAGRNGAAVSVTATLTNAGAGPVTAEVRDQVAGRRNYAVAAESQPHDTKAGDPVWRLDLPANGEASVTYTAEFLFY
jgi:hypothetical protein